MDEQLKSENMQKKSRFMNGGWGDKIFFTSGDKGALTPNQKTADARAYGGLPYSLQHLIHFHCDKT